MMIKPARLGQTWMDVLLKRGVKVRNPTPWQFALLFIIHEKKTALFQFPESVRSIKGESCEQRQECSISLLNPTKC